MRSFSFIHSPPAILYKFYLFYLLLKLSKENILPFRISHDFYYDIWMVLCFFRDFGIFWFWRLSFLYFFLSFFMFRLSQSLSTSETSFIRLQNGKVQPIWYCVNLIIQWYGTCKAMRGNVRCVLYHVPCTLFTVHDIRSERHSVYHAVAHNSHLYANKIVIKVFLRHYCSDKRALMWTFYFYSLALFFSSMYCWCCC